ncbi:meiotic chromosome segregation protein [Malassezia pachydermatis]
MGHALRDGGVPTPEKTRSKAAAALPTPPRVPSSTRVVLMDGLPTTRIHVARPTPLPSEWVQEDHTSPLPTPTADEHDAERMSCESTQRPDDMCPASVTRRRPSRRHSGMVPPPRLEVAAADEVAAITPPPPPPPPPPPAATADVDVDVPCTPTSTRDEPVETPTPTPTRPKSKTPQKRARRTSVLSELGMTDDVVPDRARRARKSVNYALPKLNTKMRKPDPTEEGPTSKKPRTSRTHPKDEPSTPRAASPSLTTDDTPSEVAAARPRRSRTSSTQSAAAEEAKEAAVAPAMDVDATALAPPRTPLPTSVRSSRSGTPFVPSRGRHVNAGLLQQQSSHNMPSWASSLMHLASPEPPASKVSAAPSTRRRRSVAVHEKENEGS